MLRAFGVTDKGSIRPTNEDCFGIDRHLHLCIVADGLGGHRAGEVAARIAVESVTRYVGTCDVTTCWPFGFDPALSHAGNLLRTAVHVAHTQILEAAVTAHEYAGMGTTIVAALVRDNRLSVAHVGDSRLYVFRHRRAAGDAPGCVPPPLRLLTRDDSWAVSMLANDPHASLSMLQDHPMRHVLTNVVGARRRTEVHVTEEVLTGGELLVLTTDGVHGVLDDRRMERVMAEAGDATEIAPGLISAALARGSRDNCTAVVAEYVPD